MTLWQQALLWSWMPGLFWLVYVESRAPQPSRPSRILLTFLAGAFSVQGVFLLNRWTPWDLHRVPETAWDSLFHYVVVVGLVEECCKFLAVWVTCWFRRDFRESWDGLACASSAALGFATAENFVYVMNFGDPSILVGRFLLATIAHVAMSSVWGFALGWVRQGGAFSLFWEALLWSALAHGLYDWFLHQSLLPAALGVFLGLALVFRQRLQEARLFSSRRRTPTQKVIECGNCHQLLRAEYAFCSHCGSAAEPDSEVVCLNCLTRQTDGHCQTCPGCEKKFV